MSRTFRCAVYVRKSTAQGLEQEFNSLDAQGEACLHFIQSQAHQGWVACPEAYQDGGFSGSTLERPGFQSLMADIEAGKLDIVVVYKVDRLSRSLMDFARVMERFTARGVALVSVTQNFSTADAMGRLTLNMLMSFAEFEREMITERIRDKVSAARRKGCWTGGIVPFGYRVEDKHLVVIPEEAARLRWMFETYLAGRSILDLVQTLNEEGVPFKGAVKPREHPWSKGVVLRVLRNRLYTGVIASHGSWYPSQHEALIDAGTFERAQGLLSRPTHRRGSGARRTPYLVRGALRCGSCGAALTTASTRRGAKVYRYYRCTTRDKKGRAACPTRQLPAEAIEGFVVDQVRRALRGGQIDRSRLEAKANGLAEAQERLRQQQARCVEIGTEGEHHLGDLEGEIHDLQAEEAELRWVGTVLADFEGMWTLLSPENRRRVIQALVTQVVVAEQEGRVCVTLTDLTAQEVA